MPVKANSSTFAVLISKLHANLLFTHCLRKSMKKAVTLFVTA